MYLKLLAGYGVAFALLFAYVLYLRRHVTRLEQRLDDLGR